MNKPIIIKPGSTLFLDRDGVLNKQIVGDYVRTWSEFEWLKGAKDALVLLRPLFKRMIIVTNQQGVGKGLMTQDDLIDIHTKLIRELLEINVEIDSIYACTELATENPPCRKPNPGMALQAVEDFIDIDLSRSFMCGDSISDMKFGKNCRMKTIYIKESLNDEARPLIDFQFNSILEFAQQFKQS